MSTFYTNKITLQVSDSVRLIFQDVRGGVMDVGPVFENAHVGGTVGETVMSLPTARALRDLLVQYVKDEPDAGTMQ